MLSAVKTNPGPARRTILGHRRLRHEQKQRDHAGPDPPPIVRASGPPRIAAIRLTETGNKDAEQHGDADAAAVRFGHRPP